MNADVALPRTLDVQEYVNARVREVHSLSLALRRRSGRPEVWGEEPLGPIAPVRHMRRRTKSHNRHKVLFRLKKKRPKADVPGLDVNGTPTPARPASDATGANDGEEKLQGGLENSEGLSVEIDFSNIKLCRRLRRRNELKNPSGGGSWTGGGQRRLESHVWHAKRFSMVHRWGHVLAQTLPGRGRGSRSVLHALRTTTLLHDASYHAQTHLAGPQECLLAILAVLGGPLSATSTLKTGQGGHFARAFLAGTCSGSFLLKRGEATLGPAVVLWRPTSGGSHKPAEERELLLILHPAAAEECVQAIREAVAEQAPEARLVERPDRLCQVELLGAKALEVLRTVLLPPASDNGNSWAWRLFRHAQQLPHGAVMGLQVADPRGVRAEGEGGIGQQENVMVEEEGSASQAALCADANPLWTAFAESGQVAFSDCPSLWSPPGAPYSELPVADAVLCERRRQQQLARTRGDHVVDEEEQTVDVMLIKRASAGQGWTLLLPQAWSRVFWVGLVKAGGHAIGLQDHRWAATQTGVPLFPYDFPECPAHHRHQKEEERLNLIKYDKKPKAKRSSMPSLAPTWEDIISPQQIKLRGELSNQVLQGAIPSVVRTDRRGGGSPGSVRRQLWEGKVQWQAVQQIEGRANGKEEAMVAVTVVMPRKGSAEEGALICAATREDFKAWCKCTPKWQGVQDTSAAALRSAHITKHQKEKLLRRQATALSATPEKGVECEDEKQDVIGGRFRDVVGHITSATPRGSTSGGAIGVCCLHAIQKAKAQQYSEWVGGGETILALIKSAGSPVYRPALVVQMKSMM